MLQLNDSEFLRRYPQLKACEQAIAVALQLAKESFEKGNKMLIMGNGGSSADAEHMCAELTKGCLLRRELHDKEKKVLSQYDAVLPDKLQGGLPAMSLGVAHSFFSAFANDVDFDYVFAQQIWVHGKPGDAVFAITTSGESKNIISGLATAKAKGLSTILLTGVKENSCDRLADVSIKVPESETYKIQELHLPIYHFLCIELEKIFFWRRASGRK